MENTEVVSDEQIQSLINWEELEEVKEVIEEPKEEIIKEEVIEEPKQEPQKQNKVIKLLSERNKAKQEAESLRQELETLKSKSLTETDDPREHDLSLIEKLVEKKLAERMAVEVESKEWRRFEKSNQDLKDNDLDQIKKLSDEHPTLSLEAVKILHLAQTRPDALLTEQAKNKIKGWYDIIWNESWPTQTKSYNDMSSDELEKEVWKLVNQGKIVL